MKWLFRTMILAALYVSGSADACIQITNDPPTLDGVTLEIGVVTRVMSTNPLYPLGCFDLEASDFNPAPLSQGGFSVLAMWNVPSITVAGQTTVITAFHSSGDFSSDFGVPVVTLNGREILLESEELVPPPGSISLPAHSSYYDAVALNLDAGTYTVRWVINGGSANETVLTKSLTVYEAARPVPTLSAWGAALLAGMVGLLVMGLGYRKNFR